MLALGWDRGCTSSDFFAYLHIRSLVAVDVGHERARTGELRSADGRATYIHVADYLATESADLAFTNRLFDHMTPTDRTAAAVLIHRSLKAGGLVSVWENNPWAPGTMWGAMPSGARGPSGRVTARETRRLLRGVGFDIVHTTSAFFFPRGMAWAHGLEPLLASIPLGGQYMVLARKP
jgi:hypothetical protein